MDSAAATGMSSYTFTTHCSPVSSCCGVTLRSGVMWIAEICAVTGFALVIFSGFAVDEILWHWHHREATFFGSMHGIALFLGIIQVVTSVMLGLGALRENPKLLKPWLIFFSVQTVLLLLAMLATCVVIIIYIEPVPIGITLFLVTIAYVYAFRYFILVVYSYYRQLMVVSHGTTAGVIQLT